MGEPDHALDWKCRRMDAGDLDKANELLRAAFALDRSFLPRLRRYLALEPDGWLVGEVQGEVQGAPRLAGTVGTLSYGGFAYIGLMAVAPVAQSRGVGRRLLEAALASLDRRGVGCAVLDATAAGAPLYERLGFVDAGLTYDLVRVAPGAEPEPAAVSAAGAQVTRATTARDLADVASVDARHFGADRTPMWTRLAAEGFPLWLVRAGSAGRGDGALGAMALQPGQIGPWVAEDVEVGAALLRCALAEAPRDQPLRVQVPGDALAARELLLGTGFEVRKALRHMRRGDLTKVPSWARVYGKGSYCLG
jgi:ribosomal protein S18 acetylase RimI-like enzyme